MTELRDQMRRDAEALRSTRRSGEAGMDRVEAFERLFKQLPQLVDDLEQAEAAIERARLLVAYCKRDPQPHPEHEHLCPDDVLEVLGGQPPAAEWCKCDSCWGWFVEDHPGEDLDGLGRDRSWWSGLPVHRDPPGQPPGEKEEPAPPDHEEDPNAL